MDRLINKAPWAAIAGTMLAVSSPAAAEIDDLVRQALALEQKGQMAEAYALLAPQLPTRAGDVDYDYAFGVAATDTGHSADAILAFQRVLAVQPGNAQARAEIARAYARAGDAESARAQFDTVLDDPSIPDPVRQRFNRIVRDLDTVRSGGATDVTGFVEASGGYDGNINTATNLTSITLPIFSFLGPASLSGAAVSQDGGFGGVAGGISVRTPLSAQTSLFASLLGDSRFNTRNSDFDQVSGTGTAGIAHTLANRDVLSLSGQYQEFWLGGDHYRTAYGAIGQYTKRLAGGRALSFGLQYYRLDYASDPLRDADRYSASISYAGRIALISLSGGKEQVRERSADNLSNGFVGLRGGIEKPLSSTLAVVMGAGIEGRWHDADDPLFLKARRDTQLDGSLAVKLLVTRTVYLKPGVSYTRNFSNIDLYDYRRFTATLAIRADF